MNLATQLIKSNAKHRESVQRTNLRVIREVAKTLPKDDNTTTPDEEALAEALMRAGSKTYQTDVLTTLGMTYALNESDRQHILDKFPKLDPDRIVHIDTIQQMCYRFGLRFLSSSYFKGQLDAGIAPALAAFQAGLPPHTEVRPDCFAIMAPAASFVLQPRPKDPVLFASLGKDYYYIIHKWGTDLSIWRSWRAIFGMAVPSDTTAVLCTLVGGMVTLICSIGCIATWVSVLPGFAIGLAASLGLLVLARGLWKILAERGEKHNKWNNPYAD